MVPKLQQDNTMFLDKGQYLFNLLTVTGPPVGPFAIACLKQLYPILKLI